jgi:hypothetical protein
LIAAALLFVGVPWTAHRFFSQGRWANAAPLQKKDEAVVLAGAGCQALSWSARAHELSLGLDSLSRDQGISARVGK